jgi:hypothetical protein
MGLYVSVYVSFNCKLSFARVCIWNCSKVFVSGPFFSRCNILCFQLCHMCVLSLKYVERIWMLSYWCEWHVCVLCIVF